MTDRVSALVAFFRELKRRRVVHAVIVYGTAAFLVLEGVSNLSDALQLSGTFQFAVAVAVIAGFPVAVVLAWMYEWTPDGVRRAEGSELSGVGRRATAWGLVVLLLLAAAGVAAVAARSVGSGEAAAGEVAAGGATMGGPAAVGGSAGAPGSPGSPVTGAGRRVTVLAVLPFNHSADSEAAGRLAMALEAQVEAALAESPSFVLRWRSAVKPLLAQGLPIDSVARLLEVDYFVHAQVMEAEASPTVVVELVDARTMNVIRSSRVQETGAGTIGLLDALTRRIEDILRPALGEEIQLREWRAATSDSVAFHLRWLAERRWETAMRLGTRNPEAAVRELTAADSLLQVALERDPGWHELYLTRARVASQLALALRPGGDRAAVADAFDRGIRCLDQALALAPGDPEGRALRGRLLWRKSRLAAVGREERDRLVARAEGDLRAALAADPTSAEAAAALSDLLFDRGRFDEALHFGEQAYRADAYQEDASEIINRLAMAAFELEDDEEARGWCREGLRRDPDSPMHHACMLTVLGWGGGEPEPTEARAHYATLLRTAPPEARGVAPHYTFALAAALARAGEEAEARELMERARREADQRLGPGSLLWLEAALLFRLGERDGALDRVRTLAEQDPAAAALYADRRILRRYLEEAAVSLPG